MRVDVFEHRFVEFVPRDIEPAVLYISIDYATVVHLCASGCGNRVVTPLSPAGWQLLFDGETVSLTPSIGNWGLPCHSHYFIRRNGVVWAATWSRQRVLAAHAADERARANWAADRRSGSASAAQPDEGDSVQGNSELTHRDSGLPQRR